MISFLPDLAMPKYGARYGASAAKHAGGVLPSIMGLLEPETGDWLLLRYLYQPDSKSPQDRLRLFIRVHAGDKVAGKFQFPGEHLLKEFYSWTPVAPDQIGLGFQEETAPLFVVDRNEELLHDPEKDLLHYAPVAFLEGQPTLADGLNIDALFHSLTVPCLVDISARPLELTDAVGQALLSLLRDLDRHASAFDPERRDAGSIEDLSRQHDLLAARHRDFYQQYFDTLYSGRICEFGIRVMSADKREGALVARSLAEALGAGGKARVRERPSGKTPLRMAVRAGEHFVEQSKLANGAVCFSDRLAGVPKRLQTTVEEQFLRATELSHLCFLADMQTAGRMLTLPTSDGLYLRTIRIESEMRGVRLDGKEKQGLIEIGAEAERPSNLAVGLDQAQKHLFVAGVTGSGKTTTILNILQQLWEKHQVPFLVLEPAKSEYRILADGGGKLAKDLRIYSPGNERLSPFRFNPLEVPSGVTVEEHISALEACFAGAIPMSGGPLPSLISEAIVRCYEEAGFSLGDEESKGRPWPTMKTLVSAAKKIMDNRGYVGEVKANLQTAIDVRLNSLCQRSVGRMFSFSHSFPTLDELMRWPTILEMDALNLDQQNLLMLFLLNSVRERLARQGPSKGLKHVIVLEEAHNLIGVQSAKGQVSEDFADPRGHAARFLVRMLAEIRAFGEGIMVVDQSPAAIAPEVLKNTAVKIVHRTVSEDDRDALAAAMLMDKYAHEELARLEVGEAFAYNEQLYRPVRVRSPYAIEGMNRPDDLTLAKSFASADWYQASQERRLDNMQRKLEQLRKMLREALVASIRQSQNIQSAKDARNWQASLLTLVEQARVKSKQIISDAMLDRGLSGRATDIGNHHLEQMQELVVAASKQIPRRNYAAKKQKREAGTTAGTRKKD